MSFIQKIKKPFSFLNHEKEKPSSPEPVKAIESIYALKNVDVRTIRPLKVLGEEIEDEVQIKESSVTTRVVSSPRKDKVIKEQQFPCSLDFGIGFREWIDSYRLQEPISVLGLSSQAEKGLLESNYNKVGDLIGIDQTVIKGIGQGHIDEIQTLLEAYLEGQELKYCSQIDFASFLRCLLGQKERVVLHKILQPYGLEQLFSLSPAEVVEVKHLGVKETEAERNQLKQLIVSPIERSFINSCLEEIGQAFLIPWMRNRQGLATETELTERLLKVSLDAEQAEGVLRFLSDIYFEGQFPLSQALHHIEGELYAKDTHVVQDYFRSCRTVSSYFYRQGNEYLLKDLLQWIERDFSRRWISFPQGWIEKCIRLSPDFQVIKHSNRRDLIVKMY